MGDGKKLLDELNTPEGRKKMEDWANNFAEKEKNRTEIMKNMMTSTNYLEWLIRFTQDKEGFSDDEWLYFPEKIEESDREKVDVLCLFYDGIDKFAQREQIDAIPCEFGSFYKIRFNEYGFKIGILVGQGTVFFCERVPIDDEEDFIDFKEIIESSFMTSEAPKANTKVFYAVAVYSELGKPEIKAYCRTKKIAKRELKKYTDEWYSDPPEPDDKHILRLEMILE